MSLMRTRKCSGSLIVLILLRVSVMFDGIHVLTTFKQKLFDHKAET